VKPLVSDAEGVGHLKGPVGKHRGLKAVSPAALSNCLRLVGADGQHLNPALIKLVSKLFPSP
jgi:hypothetical protein